MSFVAPEASESRGSEESFLAPEASESRGSGESFLAPEASECSAERLKVAHARAHGAIGCRARTGVAQVTQSSCDDEHLTPSIRCE
jgi:hypothetical protein